MAALISPGVSVNIIDETFNVGANPGTVPLIVIATKENKLLPDGSDIAEGTTKQMANRIFAVTSQREALQLFGNPLFKSVAGTQVNGDVTNEYGLLAVHSYLGSANLAYVVRADLDLSQLTASIFEPRTAADPGSYWLDLSETRFGLFKYNSGNYVSEEVDRVFLETDPSAITPVSDENDAVGYQDGILTYYYREVIENPPNPTIELWSSDLPGYRVQPVWPTTSVGSPITDGDMWVKTTPAANGAYYVVKRKSFTTGLWTQIDCPILANESSANAHYGAQLQPGVVFAEYNTTTASFTFKILVAVGQWAVLSDMVASYTEPTNGPVTNTLWFNSDLGLTAAGMSTVDMLINTGNAWENVNLPGYHYNQVTGATTSEFDDSLPVIYLQPFNPLDGVVYPHTSAQLNSGDIWVDTSDAENYPNIKRYSSGTWVQVENSDQSTPNGILFADARPAPLYVADIGAPLSQASPDLDPDAPDVSAYPVGMLLWNSRFSSMNVKEFHEDYMYNGVLVGPRWVSASGNDIDGSLLAGSAAQRAVVVKAINASLVDNEDLRSENIYFNLIAVPGFPETSGAMVTLNIDRKETAFIIADTPMTLENRSTTLQRWATNAEQAPVTNDKGISMSYPYIAFNYPGAVFTTNVDGSFVVSPSSHAALRVYSYNDQIAYPWFAPAGETRGVVNNATSVGYVNDEGEYVPVSLTNGQRDLLYSNNINPIAQFAGNSPMIWGQKTRNSQGTALSRVNVARLAVYVRYQLDRIARRFLFEQNDEITRKAFKEAVDRFLSELVTLRGIYDFATVCDESNNTPARIDRNEMWLDVALQPTRTAEFIYIPVRLQNTGSF